MIISSSFDIYFKERLFSHVIKLDSLMKISTCYNTDISYPTIIMHC